MALIKIDGQEIVLEDSIAKDDTALRNALTPFFPQLANAEISRQTDGEGLMTVRLIKKAGPKGNIQRVISDLQSAPEFLNPAIELAWKIKHGIIIDPNNLQQVIKLQPEIQKSISVGTREQTTIQKTAEFLIASPSDTNHPGVIGF
ncbi:MAG: hypothetical protein ICV78_18225 [Tolypothrix sp. Co-bin9]|nr:hypothetical protein [Tolypothrix sp. Co-bin9]